VTTVRKTPADQFEYRARRGTKILTCAILAMGGVLIVAMWLCVVLFINADHVQALARARSEADNLSAAFHDEVIRTLASVAGAMDLVAAQMRAHPEGFDIFRWAREIPQMAPPTIQGGIIGPDGKLLSTTLDPHPSPVDLSDREHFRIHLNGAFKGLFISKPVVGRVSKLTTVQVSRRVESADGRFLGVVVFSLDPRQLTSLHKSVDLGKRGVIALVGTDNVIRARFGAAAPDGSSGMGTSVASGPQPKDIQENGHGNFVTISPVDQVSRTYSYRRLANYPLVVFVGLDLDDVLAPPHAHASFVVLGAATVTLLLGALALGLIREILKRSQREIDLARKHIRLAAERSKLAAANSELHVRREQAEAATAAKSRFISHVSHELRTPLNAIIGFSQVIKDGHSGDALVVSYATEIWHAGNCLLRLVNGIIEMSNVELGRVTLSDTHLQLEQVVHSCLLAIRERAKEKYMSITTCIPDELPPICIDAAKLRQIVTSLLSNAVKFTPDGGHITISTTRTLGDGIAITIADTGIGMSEAEVTNALEPFTQVDGALARKFDGIGLGLSLSKRLIELYGGRIAIESTKGRGSTVSVHIPEERIVRRTA
jgi:signal transduction histidine kinase